MIFIISLLGKCMIILKKINKVTGCFNQFSKAILFRKEHDKGNENFDKVL